jgi:hypothetical protein
MAFNNGARGQFRLQADINGWTLIHHDDHNDTFEKNGVKIGVAYRTNYSFGKAWLASDGNIANARQGKRDQAEGWFIHAA